MVRCASYVHEKMVSPAPTEALTHREILYHTLLPDRGSSLNSLLGYSEQGLPDIGGVHAVLPRLRLYAYPLMRRIAEGRESSQGRRR